MMMTSLDSLDADVCLQYKDRRKKMSARDRNTLAQEEEAERYADTWCTQSALGAAIVTESCPQVLTGSVLTRVM